jgi:hypothetical protein
MWPCGAFRVDGDRSLRKGLEPFKLGRGSVGQYATNKVVFTHLSLYDTAHSIMERDAPEVVGKVSRITSSSSYSSSSKQSLAPEQVGII